MRTCLSILCFLTLAACETSTAHGLSGESLTLTSPANQWLRRGSTNKVAVHVTRNSLSGPVEIEFLNLPEGVTVVEGGPMAQGDSIKNYALQVAPDAPLVKQHVVTVVASAHSLRTEQTFQVDVGMP